MLDLLPYLALGSLRSLLALASILQMIVSISDVVTMNGFLGKCLMFVPYCMCFMIANIVQCNDIANTMRGSPVLLYQMNQRELDSWWKV